ncbi:MAG: hypothetical protein HETSPECPRED_004278 [Heterodermia speciosa]|uniref:Fungal N-terminal domain-containing protein n=1 Tax=Heterodermia speciosa TaxID=116794 RepID=A0A8H3F9P2_9LECA|nr:MAG: hypothetical protein HETSPECPRED_004278 [Heterodermia speciosa]
MSFGSSIGDLVLLTQLAWKTVQNCRRACGEYAALTLEATSLHTLLQRLESELRTRPNGLIINRDIDDVTKELANIVQGCEKNLRVLDLVLEKYNALSETQGSGRKLWQRVRFGNGQVADMIDIRSRNTFYISAISLFLNMLHLGSAGRVEREMTQAGGELRDIRLAVNGITAYLMRSSGGPEGSVLTAYANDEKAVWKEFRRELVADGFTSSTIRKHKQVIMAYVKELGSRGLLDETDHNENCERDGETSRGFSDLETVEPQVDKRSPNEPASPLQDINPVEGTNPEERSTRIQPKPNPASDVATPDPREPTPASKPNPISRASTPNSSEQLPPPLTTTPTPPTILSKLRAIELKLHTSLIPRCEALIRNPPSDLRQAANRQALADEILLYVIYELNAIDTEGEAELGALRRDLLWQARVWLEEVDRIPEPEPGSDEDEETCSEEERREEWDIWPPGSGSGGGGSADGARFGPDAPNAWPPGPDEDEVEEIEPGISGKYKAWLTFAEGYIRESRLGTRTPDT